MPIQNTHDGGEPETPPAESSREELLSPLTGVSFHSGPTKVFRLVILDNHNLFREGLLRLLVMEGGFAPVSGTLSEAGDLVRHFWPELVLFGLGPMEERGIHHAKALRAEFPSIRLLLLDEKVCTRHVQETVAIQAEGYWTKHVDFSSIVTAMRSVAMGQHSFCPEVEKHLRKTPTGLHFEPSPDSAIFLLTQRETELFLLLARGRSLRECAEQMRISENTVDNHRARLMSKLGIRKTVDLARLAVREGLLED